LLSTNDLWQRRSRQLPATQSCDLLSTNDLWQPSSQVADTKMVVICFQQTIFDNSLSGIN